MKIIITGGHLMPALALIDRLTAEKNEIVFVGRKFNLSGENSLSLEYQEIKKRNIKFIPVVTGRVQRELSLNALNNFFLIFRGLIEAWKVIQKEKPQMVFSFGSYLGFPFALTGWLAGIPVYIHEQTISPGLANKISSFFCRKVFVSFPQSAKYFPGNKVIVCGNPIRREIFKVEDDPFKITDKLPVIYITGGSLGSHSLNAHFVRILPQLLRSYNIIHQVGNVREYHDFEELTKLRNGLEKTLQERYFLREHIYTDEIGFVFSQADLVICRAGANTFFELIALKKPAILVPLPWSANHEQQKQAELFSDNGFGEVFYQSESSEKLLQLIALTMGKLDEYKKNFTNSAGLYKDDAAETICKHIFKR